MIEARILIVEDDEVLLENLAEILQSEGFEVLTAEDGRKAQVVANEALPDLIVSDVMMPDMDGFTLASELSQEAHTALIPIIFLTAKSSREEFRTGMDLGAEDYLPKPCPADKLVSVIRMRLTRRRRLQKELADQWRGMGLRHLTLPLDIGNPLRQILGFAGVLIAQGADLGPEEIRQVAHDVGMAGFRLTRKVTQLRLREALELRQQVDWGESEAHCDAELVLRRAVKQCVVFGPRVRDMVSSIEPGTLMIREGIVGAVLAELLDNALRYSTPGSPVRLLGEVTAEGYRVSVENQISEAVGERVAERLRVPDAGSPVGTQCSGLTVVRALLQSCKIEPEIESDPSGRIVAHFTIPVAQLY